MSNGRTLVVRTEFGLRAAAWVSRRAVLLLVFTAGLVSGIGCSETTVTTVAGPEPASPATLQPAATEPAPSSGTSQTSDGPPPVTLADEAQMQALIAGTEGKVLVVNIWATYCIPCIQEMPLLSRFYQEMDPENVAFLSISADIPYSVEETVKPFVTDHKVAFPVAVLNFDDPDPNILAAMLGVSNTGWDGALPATFVFDRNHTLQSHVFEELQPGQLEKLVRPLFVSS